MNEIIIKQSPFTILFLKYFFLSYSICILSSVLQEIQIHSHISKASILLQDIPCFL